MLKFKRTVSLLLSAIMLISLFALMPATVNAYVYEDWEYSPVYGQGVTYIIDKYNGDFSEVFVPGVFIISDTNKRYIKMLGKVFQNNTKIKSVEISEGIKDMESTFDSCTNLTDVKLPSTLTNLSWYSFQNCTSLKNIDIPDKVNGIGDSVFYNCTSLENITLGIGIEKIRNHAFENCTALKKISIPAKVSEIYEQYTTEHYPDMKLIYGCCNPYNAFHNCTSLETIDVDKDNETYCSVDGNVYSKDKTKIVLYAIGKKDKSFTIPDTVTSIGTNAFEGSQNLEKITIPEGIKTITTCSFYNCPNLKKVVLPSTVKSIAGSAFRYCKNITDVYYAGTKSEWEELYRHISGYNGGLANATIHCLGDIPEEKRYTNSDGDIIGLNEKLTRASDDTVLSGIGSSFNNLDILGVQKKNDKEAKSVRFVSVLNNEIAKDAEDYGYIAVGAKSMDTARSVVESYTLDKAPAKHIFSCKGSDNSVSGDYGKSSTDTKYKYVTFSINNIGDNSVAVMFYVKDKNGNVYYSPYTNADGDTYNSCSVNWEALN